MSRINISYADSERFVAEQNKLGNDVRWDGWDMVFFKSNPNGFTDKHGAFRNGRWGVQTRVTPGVDGIWRVPVKNVRNS